MGEKILKKIVYTSELDDDIISHENKMLKLYKEKIEKNYLHVFEEKGFSLNVKLSRISSSKNSLFYKRDKNGYECYVCCDVQKNNKTVNVISDDGEVDYYILSVAWMVSCIHEEFFKLKVLLFEDIDDKEIDEDLENFLQKLKTGSRIFLSDIC